MSQNTGQHSLSTSSSSLTSNNNNRRVLSNQQLLPNSLDFSPPSTILSTSQNESPSTQSRTVRYTRERERLNEERKKKNLHNCFSPPS